VTGAAVLFALLGAPVWAQDEPPAAPYPHEPVFHSYSNLIQIPVLVLDEHRQPLAADTPLQFGVRIDGGPEFTVKYDRLEGNDPIALAILLDLSGSQKPILPKVAEAIAGLPLKPQDRVSVYAVDCRLIRTYTNGLPNAEELKQAVNNTMQSTTVHGPGKTKASCGSSRAVRSSLMYMISQLEHEPGRRVILALTDGEEKYSSYTWKAVKEYADNSGVAIFGLAGLPYEASEAAMFQTFYRGYEDEFKTLCELSGGILRMTTPLTVPQSVKDFVALVRGRYIVEFPRSDNLTAGPHGFDVSVESSKELYFIRPSGISLPIADPEILADPTTVPTDPTHAPVPGNRRILTDTKH
jgi:hypothetical protein